MDGVADGFHFGFDSDGDQFLFAHIEAAPLGRVVALGGGAHQGPGVGDVGEAGAVVLDADAEHILAGGGGADIDFADGGRGSLVPYVLD